MKQLRTFLPKHFHRKIQVCFWQLTGIEAAKEGRQRTVALRGPEREIDLGHAVLGKQVIEYVKLYMARERSTAHHPDVYLDFASQDASAYYGNLPQRSETIHITSSDQKGPCLPKIRPPLSLSVPPAVEIELIRFVY